MKFSKLALRNVKKSYKDYFVYFMTLLFLSGAGIESEYVAVNRTEDGRTVYECTVCVCRNRFGFFDSVCE